MGQNPEHYASICRDVRHARLKRFPYAVFYRLEAARIVVASVHHAQRDPARWRNRS
ncbi:hypothetical protein [Aquisphaera giovannonii]|uniref:hypothetical protein n=1 Tax=Aquisphaera giovannonii TaxID=406548 RepID=UPI001AEFD2BC